MAKLKETTSRYDDLKVTLTTSLEEVGHKLQDGKIDTSGAVDVATQVQELKTITDQVESQRDKLEDLKEVGNDLLTILDALDCKDTPKGRDIESTMQNLDARFSNLLQNIQVKQKKLDDKLFQTLQQWVQKNKKVFNDIKPVSVDRDILNEQVQTHQDVTAELEARQLDLATLKDRQQDKPAQIKKCKTISENITALGVKAKERAQALEGVVQKLEPFHLAVYQLESWHSYASHSIKQESTDVEFLFTKIDNVFKQRQEKQEHLQTMKDIGKKLLEDAALGDKNKLQEVIDIINTKWEEVGDHLVRLISSAAVRRVENFSKFLEKVGKDLESAEAPSADPELVAKQYTDHQVTHADLKKTQKLAVDAVNNYKNMYKTLTEQEPGDIQAKWSAAQKEFMAMSMKSEERLGLLEEAQPAQLSADIDMDEILQDWIEVDTVEGDEDKDSKSHTKAPRSQSKSSSSSKRSSSGSRAPAKGSATVKKEDVKKSDDKKIAEKPKTKPAEKPKSDVKKDTSDGEKKKEESKKMDSKKETETKSKESAKKETPKKQEDSKTSRKETTTKDDNKKEKTNNTTKKAESKPTSSSKGKARTSTEASEDKGFSVTLHAGKHSAKSFEHGIVITNINIKDTHFKEVMMFVKPHVPKIGLVKFFTSDRPFVFVGLTSAKEVSTCINKLDKRALKQRRVGVRKANVTVMEDKEQKNSDEKLSTIFDTPENSKEGGKPTSSSPIRKTEAKKGVLTLEEIKKGKQDELLRQMHVKREKRLATTGSSKPEETTSKPRVHPKKPVRILTLSELRAERTRPGDSIQRTNVGPRRIVSPRDQRGAIISPRDQRGAIIAPRDQRGVGRRPDMGPGRMGPGRMEVIPNNKRIDLLTGQPVNNLFDSKELERERQRVRLEQERLERERLQAERERVALERERQRREMDQMMYQRDNVQRPMKRSLSPSGQSGGRTDGSYWMQPKRPALDWSAQQRNTGGFHGSGNNLQQGRREINTTFEDRTLSHLRFDDMRPTGQPGQVHHNQGAMPQHTQAMGYQVMGGNMAGQMNFQPQRHMNMGHQGGGDMHSNKKKFARWPNNQGGQWM